MQDEIYPMKDTQINLIASTLGKNVQDLSQLMEILKHVFGNGHKTDFVIAIGTHCHVLESKQSWYSELIKLLVTNL